MKTIKINNLSKWYSKLLVLSNVSLELFSGKCYLFIGGNGSGKSTFFKALLGVINISSGSIDKEGIIIGYVPEKIVLPNHMRVDDFLFELGKLRGVDEEKLEDIINDELKNWKMIDKRKNKIITLSKGMVQKILIIQAILHSPDVLILDEVLNGLDISMQAKLILYIKRWKEEGKIVLVSSHYPKEYVGVVDEVFKIEEGKISKC